MTFWIIFYNDNYYVQIIFNWGVFPNVHIEQDIAPDSKIHGANMGPIWGRQDPAEAHVGPMNFAIWGMYDEETICFYVRFARCVSTRCPCGLIVL